jgi:hypothetical protein
MPDPTGRPGGPTPDGDPAEAALRRHLRQRADAVDPGPAPRVGDLGATAPPRRWPAALAVAAAVSLLAVASTFAARAPEDDAPVAAATASQTASQTASRTADPSADPSTDPSPAPAPTVTVTRTVPGDADPTAAPSGTDGTQPAPGPTVTVTVDGTGDGAAGGDDPDPGAGDTAPPQPGSTTVVVWQVSDPDADAQDLRLVPGRVPVQLPDGPDDTTRRVSAALTQLLSAGSRDPDHWNTWWWEESRTGIAPFDGAEPVAVDVTAGGTTVTLPEAATRAPIGGCCYGAALSQLVRTVASNDGTMPVTLRTADGATELWGAVSLAEPLDVADGVPLVGGWVLDPYEGQRVRAGALTVSGTATAFEGTAQWEVLDGDGRAVDSGFTQAGANGEYGPFSFTTELTPGSYTVRAFEESAAGPDEGPPVVWEHTTAITVVG